MKNNIILGKKEIITRKRQILGNKKLYNNIKLNFEYKIKFKNLKFDLRGFNMYKFKANLKFLINLLKTFYKTKL